MTHKEFINHRWKAYEVVWFKRPRFEWAYEMMVAGVDFDDESILVTPLEDIYEQFGKEGIWVGIQFIEFKNPRPDKIKQLKKV